jgi:hypothetical protein
MSLLGKDMIRSYAAANAAALPTSESKRDKKRRRNDAARNVSREERNMMAIKPQIDKMEQKEEDAKATSRHKWRTTEEAYKKIKRKCPEIAGLPSAKFITFICG